jgi:hypothetical protein
VVLPNPPPAFVVYQALVIRSPVSSSGALVNAEQVDPGGTHGDRC